MENLFVRLKNLAVEVHTALNEGNDGGVAADRDRLRELWDSSHVNGGGIQDRLDKVCGVISTLLARTDQIPHKQELELIVVDQVRDLRAALRDGLESKCRLAALNVSTFPEYRTVVFLFISGRQCS